MEDDFFLQKMKGVKPIQNQNKRIVKKNNNIKIDQTKKSLKKINKHTKSIPKKTITKSEYTLSFGEINKDLKRGRIKIDRRLDLHGYTLHDAKEKFKDEILNSYNKNKRCVLVITGKGVRMKQEEQKDQGFTNPKLYYGKIKNSINSWIEDGDLKKYILTYQNASLEHGGDGATFVYLRKKKI